MKVMAYGTFETLRRQKAVLRETVELNSGIQLAAWYNNRDTVTVRSDHHTLSLYIRWRKLRKRRRAGKTAAARIVFA
jgi:AraC family transcriptional regulator